MSKTMHLCATAIVCVFLVSCGGSSPTGSSSSSSGSSSSSSSGNGGDGGADVSPTAGITGCAAAFVDSDGICRPSAEKCPGGQIPKFDTGCVPVGITGCAKAFVETDGTCHVSASKCAAGEIPVPTEGCVPIDGPEGCGTAPWGSIADDALNVYVDPSYTGTPASNGSKSAPFTTIAAALAQAASGGRVVLAAGAYAEPIDIEKQVEIAGRCPSMVTITGTIPGTIPSVVKVGTSDGPVTLRGIRISGPAVGVLSGGDVSLDWVWVNGTTAGIVATSGATSVKGTHVLVQDLTGSADGSYGDGMDAKVAALTLDASAIVRAQRMGIDIAGTKASSITNSLVEGTLSEADNGSNGYGLTALSTIHITGCAFVGNHGAAVDVAGPGKLTLDDSNLEHTATDSATNAFGIGVLVQTGAQATVTGCLVSDNISAGVEVYDEDSSLQLKGTLIVGTKPQPADMHGGFGAAAANGTTLTIDDSALVSNVGIGVVCDGAGAKLAVHGTLVEGTLSDADDHENGLGISTQNTAESTIDRVLLLGNRSAGFFVENKATATLTNSLIEKSLADANGTYGEGIAATAPKALSVSSTLVLSSVGAGVLVLGGPATITDSVVRDVALGSIAQPAAKPVPGIGDGLLVIGSTSGAAVDVKGSLFMNAARAGVLYENGSGSLHGSEAKGNAYGLVLQGMPLPEIGTDNVFKDNTTQDRLDGGTLATP